VRSRGPGPFGGTGDRGSGVVLKIRNLEVGYGPLKVLKRLSLHVSAGEIVTLIGANGAGKSTLLRAIAGLIPSRGGEVLFRDASIGGLPAEKIVASGVALVPEGRQVFATMSVRENLLLGGYVRTQRGRAGAKSVPDALEDVYRLFPVLKERRDQLAGTLSGGEQQMLAMGRALMTDPLLIMMDEPSMGLAPLVVKEIFETVRRLRGEGMTVLLVEQNARAALKVADRGYVIETGKLVLDGEASFLLRDREVQRAYLGKGYREVWE
jgi:branched-chain amino acid transport system ATP-binding protein